MQKITPFLWFDNNAVEAANFYTSIFKNAKTGEATHYNEAGSEVSGLPEGEVMTVPFELAGQKFIALNGGPIFKFNEAVSFVVNCDSQEEIDYYWDKLSEGGDEKAQQCGWLKDKFGLSWQIVPIMLGEVFGGDPEKSQRAMQAMLKMKKMDIAGLRKAYNGE